MFVNKPKIIILTAICIMLITESCATNTQQSSRQQSSRQQIAYDNCMKERIKDFPDVSISEAKMTAHYICNMVTSNMDDRYFDCLPITTKMFTSDGIKDAKSSATAVCKYYAQACKESPEHPTCIKNYLTDQFQRNKNMPYPGSQLKKVEYGSTLLIDLVSLDDVDTLEAVIKRGANVNESMGGNWTPLAQARSKGNQAMVEMLIRHGAK